MKKQVPENPEKNRTGSFSYLVVISALLVTCYLTANIMAVKLIGSIDVAYFDAGTITFPFAYMLGDVLAEIWGFKTSRRVIYLTFVCNVLLVTATTIGVFIPSPVYMDETAKAYDLIFTIVPRILAASLVAFLVGELLNAWFMILIKRWTKGKHLWLRTIGSSAVGYFFDTVLFVFIAFAGTAPLRDLFVMIGAQYAMKMGIEMLFATPIAYGVIGFIRRKESELVESEENNG